MNFRGRHSPQAERFAERRRREDEVPRLREQVPDLTRLQLNIEERTGSGGNTHTRRIVIDAAPALFLVPCGDPRCVDGGHDLTTLVMYALRSRKGLFHGEDACSGSLGPSTCARGAPLRRYRRIPTVKVLSSPPGVHAKAG
jgi:hypothetical protein